LAGWQGWCEAAAVAEPTSSAKSLTLDMVIETVEISFGCA
jgi:hypothetical protein